jgi:RES domain-containing protein
MILWRISNFTLLDGEGGTFAPGRWHSMPRYIVYTSDHPASALLETIVHLDRRTRPKFLQLLKIKVGHSASIKKPRSLPKGWQSDTTVTQRIGDEWLDQNQSTLLAVPSALVPETSNYLINPFNAQSKAIKIVDVLPVPLDTRLN